MTEQGEDSNSCNSQDKLTEGVKTGDIKAISKSCVHRICSGQVVLTLATAIKELVENSIDAHATSIDIRLKKHGSELVEVIDNGTGVEQHNFEALTLKHHTSKLQDFSDLSWVETFGFRGEALSSLCALSKLTIATCHASSDVGTRLEYNHSGNIIARSMCPRTQGTTVTLSQLFSTLPVRRQEFQRNVLREFGQAVRVLTAYCLGCTGVRISCTHLLDNGKKNLIVSSNGHLQLQENIANVYGTKQLQNLLELRQYEANDETMTEFSIENTSQTQLFQFSGFISSCDHGKGRGSSDRQFFFVNKRPCDLPKVSRLVNEVYRSYNKHQYPFVVIDIKSQKESVDVNVTPDKRKIFLLNEKLLLATIKTSLVKLFEPRSSVYQLNSPGLGLSGQSIAKGLLLSRCSESPAMITSPAVLETTSMISSSPSLANLKRNFSSAFSRQSNTMTAAAVHIRKEDNEPASKQRCLDNFIKRTDKTADDASRTTVDNDEQTVPSLSYDLLDYRADCLPSDEAVTQSTYSSQSLGDCGSGTEADSASLELHHLPTDSSQQTDSSSCHEMPIINSVNDGSSVDICDNDEVESVVRGNDSSSAYTDGNMHCALTADSRPVSTELCTHDNSMRHSFDDDVEGDNGKNIQVDEPEVICRKESVVAFSMQRTRHRKPSHRTGGQTDEKFCRTFRAKISPGQNSAAEEELSRSISKDMFAKMEILGQFNLGFIIVKLEDDLFIIDQHASDEKYNFEMLRRHTVIHNQKLIQPQSLGLTAANESILIDNLETFLTNGFEFEINEEAAPTERVKLVSMPVSRNWTFGKDDVEELIFMLTDSPGVLCRPSRICQMFASRACRKSVMIGTALNKRQMKKLVCHLGELDQPWNCPHGRPTMRHVINLKMLPT